MAFTGTCNAYISQCGNLVTVSIANIAVGNFTNAPIVFRTIPSPYRPSYIHILNYFVICEFEGWGYEMIVD